MDAKREKALVAIKKAGSLLKTMQSMMDDGAYCVDVMQQNLAVIGLLKSAHQSLMEGHLNSCVKEAMTAGSAAKKQRIIDEILSVSRLANK